MKITRDTDKIKGWQWVHKKEKSHTHGPRKNTTHFICVFKLTSRPLIKQKDVRCYFESKKERSYCFINPCSSPIGSDSFANSKILAPNLSSAD